MKVSHRLIVAMLTVCVIMTSCTDSFIGEQENLDMQVGGTRVITVSFDSQTPTRTTLSGFKPTFKEGDEIMVATIDGSGTPEICKVVEGNNKRLVIQTKLQGRLKAVYPAESAKMDGKMIDGVKVKSIQSGKFEDANICMATMNGTDDSFLEFINQTAILKFYIGEDIGVTSIKVTSSESYITDDENTTNSITVTATGTSLYEDMPTSGQPKNICYVAIKEGVSANTLTFTGITSTQGEVNKTIKSTAQLKKGGMYNAFIPYYIKVNAGTEENPIYQKWGYCNIGAFLPEEKGYFFTWGNADGHWLNGNTDSYVFNSDSYSGTSGSQIPEGDKIDPTSDNDAAHANWGDNWRMPTSSELGKLISTSSYTAQGISGKKGYYCFNGKIFLPTASKQSGSNWSEGEDCVFWSSDADNKSNGASWVGRDPDAYTSGEEDKYYGMAIRPIYEEPVVIPGEFTVNSDSKKVKFAKGLLYWDGDSFEFEENQLAYATTWDASHISHFYWSKSESVARASSYSDASASANDVLFTNATETTANPNFTVNGETGKYRALSQGEMEYLIQNNICYNKVTIGDDYFIVIATPNCSDKLKYSYTIEEWAEAEKAGLISIPYGGWRSNNDIKSRNSYMYIYTDSPKGSTDAYSVLYYTDGRCWLDHTEPRYYGYIIRLVCDVDNK